MGHLAQSARCAWCTQEPEAPPAPATHGMCEACLARVRGELGTRELAASSLQRLMGEAADGDSREFHRALDAAAQANINLEEEVS